MLLLHDIQPRTVLMLPALLSELKRRNFKIVHVVPEGERPTLAQPTVVASASNEGWPRVMSAAPRTTTGSSTEALPASSEEVLSISVLPKPRPVLRPVRHAAAKPASPQVAMRDLHAAQ